MTDLGMGTGTRDRQYSLIKGWKEVKDRLGFSRERRVAEVMKKVLQEEDKNEEEMLT